MRPYSPGGALNALAPARRSWKTPTPSAQRLQRGLPGYLILFAPHAFAPQRQVRPSKPPSPPVFLLISAHFTANQEFHLPLPTSSRPVSTADPQLSCGLSRQTRPATYELFTPNNSGQRLRPTYYRGCWHVVSRRFFCRYTSTSSLLKEVYNPKAVIPHAESLRQASAHCAIFPLLPPVGVWAVSQSQCGRSPSQAGYPSSPW